MVKKSLLSKSVEWFVCWISTKESNLGYTFLSLFCSWFFSSFSHNSFHTFHTVFCFECSPDAAFIFSRLLKPPHVPPREGWEPLIALFFVSFRIPGGTEEGLSSVYCLQCTGWKASIWRGISPALLLNRAIQVSLFPIRLQFAIIFKRTQDGVHLKALKGFHHSFFFLHIFFFFCANRELISYADVYECSHISVNTVSKSNFFTIHDFAVGAVLRFAFWSTSPDHITLDWKDQISQLDHWKAFCEFQKCVDIYLLSIYFNSLKWDYLLLSLDALENL